MNRFPANFKCILWNNHTYFTHYYDGGVNFYKKIRLKYIYASIGDIKDNNAYSTYKDFDEFPKSDLKEVVKSHWKNNHSFKHHDFSKDTFVEIAFKDLPKNVKEIFKCFEKHNDFKISESVSFHIDNTF